MAWLVQCHLAILTMLLSMLLHMSTDVADSELHSTLKSLRAFNSNLIPHFFLRTSYAVNASYVEATTYNKQTNKQD